MTKPKIERAKVVERISRALDRYYQSGFGAEAWRGEAKALLPALTKAGLLVTLKPRKAPKK